MLLLDDDSDSDGGELKINKPYAAKYDHWRQLEELQTLKDRYGDVDDSDLESTDEEVDPEAEREFLKALSCVVKRDPKIYDPSVSFFEGIDVENKKKPKKEKPIYLKDYERNQLLQTNGELNFDEEENGPDYDVHSVPLSKAKEEEEIRKSFKKAMEENESDDDDLLTEKKKTKEEKEKARADYIEWFRGNKDDIEDTKTKSEMKDLHDYWSNPSLDKNEEFLKNYILNQKYVIKDDDDDDEDDDNDELKLDEEALSDDENMIEKQTEFEHKYNFRFEEPDQEFIKHYPRIIEDTLRPKDVRRKKKRNETKLRKLQEKEQKKEELKQLKSLKRKEIMDRLKKLEEITGNSTSCFDGEFLEGEFDPETHERKMREIFDDEYYNNEETEKPEFPEDDDCEPENWDEWGVEDTQHELHCEDPDFNMDAEYDPTTSRKSKTNEEKKGKKNKRKSKLGDVLSNKKPRFDETDKTFEEYIEEYYKLDYEDIIGGDLPCRFKYRKVVPNDFGLSVEEILQADDSELNQWCSLKKAVKYRSERDEQNDVHTYKQKGQNLAKKKKILASVYQEPEVDGDNTAETSSSVTQEKGSEQASTSTAKQSKRRSKKWKGKETGLSDDRLRAYGFNPKEYKKRLKYGKK